MHTKFDWANYWAIGKYFMHIKTLWGVILDSKSFTPQTFLFDSSSYFHKVSNHEFLKMRPTGKNSLVRWFLHVFPSDSVIMNEKQYNYLIWIILSTSISYFLIFFDYVLPLLHFHYFSHCYLILPPFSISFLFTFMDLK